MNKNRYKLNRLTALIALMKKEFLAIWSDKKSRVILIVPPFLQLVVFSFAVNLEVKNISLALLDRDNSSYSQELVRSLSYSNTFVNIYPVQSQKELQEAIDTQKVLAAIYVPQDFSQNIIQNRPAAIQIIADGRKANSASIAESYITSTINQQFAQNSFAPQALSQSIISRVWYNPNLNNFWWILPNLMGSLSMIVALLLTSLSVARERELGTFEQILVSPLSPTMLIIGKTIPPLLISIIEAGLIYTVATQIFGVPFTGSIFILFIGIVSFLFSIVGIGLFISSISQTQQQAILGAFVLVVPSILLSGFATPIENMPDWLIPVTDFIALKYFLIILKGTFLKDISFMVALELIIPMLILGFVSLVAAAYMFKARLE
jgi:ABC-2 type transport system permease protein